MVQEMAESTSQIAMRMEKGSHEFIVENYSLCIGIGVNKAIESKQFTVGGNQWTICFYPDGWNDDAKRVGNVSLAVCRKNKTSSTSTARFLFELYFLDQSGKGNHYCHSIFKDATSKRVGSITHGDVSGYVHFFNRTSLKHSKYLKGDCLKIHCTIGVLTTNVEESRIIDVPKTTIGANFGYLVDNKKGADVFFKVANESFCAHKCILASRCPWFSSYFSEHHDDQEMIIIPDMEPRIFKVILWFIYTGIFLEEKQETFLVSGSFILESFLAKMLRAANKFDLRKLKKICESCILERLSGESVAYILHVAVLCDATELKVACLKFIAENQAAFKESGGYDYLKETCPLLPLESAGGVKQLSTKRMDIGVSFKDSLVSRYRLWRAKVKKPKKKNF